MLGKASVISNLVILGVGITMCLIFQRTDILRELVIIFGFIFLIPGIVELIYVLSSPGRRQNQFVRLTGWISAIGGITLGAVMLLTPQSFTAIMVYVFAFGLIVGSLNQFYVLGYGYRPLRFPGWFYLIPALVVIAGVVIVASPMLRYNDPVVVLITGIGLILIALLAFMEMISAASMNHAAKKTTVPAHRSSDDSTATSTAAETSAGQTGHIAESDSPRTVSEGEQTTK